MGATKYGFPCIGAIYEPEYTSPTEIATDIRMMKETGIGLVFTGSRLLSDAISDGETRLSALCDLLGRLSSADILAVIRLPFEERPSEIGETVVGKKPLFLPKVVIDGVSAENYLPSAEKIIKALSRYSNVVGWQICPDGSLPCDEKIIFDYIRGLFAPARMYRRGWRLRNIPYR